MYCKEPSTLLEKSLSFSDATGAQLNMTYSTTFDDNSKQYGVRISKRNQLGAECEYSEFEDITYYREEIEEIFNMFVRNTVTPITMLNVLEDVFYAKKCKLDDGPWGA